MYFEKKISVGDIIAILMAIVAIVGLALQARSTSISERQLTTQIEDISKIVADMDEQKTEMVNEQVDRLMQGKELYDSQSEMHKQLLDIGRFDRQINDMYLRALMLSQSTLHAALSTIEISPTIAELLKDGRQVNAKLAAMLVFTQQWQVELEKLSLAHDKKLNAILAIKPITNEIPEKMAEANDQYARDIAMLNGRYSEKLKPIRDGFVSNKDQLFKKLIKLYGNKKLVTLKRFGMEYNS